MAVMIPDFVHPDCKSNAERYLFDRLKEELDENYIVMHSLGLAKHGRNFSSEIDFLIVSQRGFLVLEVKGGRVRHKKGVWYFTNRYDETDSRRRSPMQQAREAMYALRANIRNHFGRDSDQDRTVFSDCVLFTDVLFQQASPEWDLKKVYDVSRLQKNISSLVEEMYSYGIEEHERVVGHLPVKLSTTRLGELRDHLRRDFDLVPSLITQVNQSYQNMIKLTDRQFKVLDMLENDRVVVRGGAGTGKTLLAMQKARNHARKGERVIFICFNALLASSLKKSVQDEELQDQILVTTLHAFCLNIIKKAGLVSDIEEDLGTHHFFQKTLPEYFPEAFCHLYHDSPFEVMIIDEGQDFKYYKPYVELVDWLVQGGLKNGRWAWFEDDKQAIFNVETGDEVFDPTQYGTGNIRLRENCRNTRPIAIFTDLVSGTEPQECLNTSGPQVEKIYYRGVKHQFKKVENMVSRLLSDGIQPDEIILLTAKNTEKSVLADHDRIAGNRLIQVGREWLNPSHSIRYTSVWKFKGLESKVIIVTDIEELVSIEARKLNYVSFSRANAYLGVCIHEACKEEFNQLAREYAMLFVSQSQM